MLRKTIHKILSFKKKKLPDKFANDSDYEEDSESETDTAKVFRRAFITKFNLFKLEADILAEGNGGFYDSWKDTLGKEGIGLSVAALVGILSLLGALSIISEGVAAGIAIVIAVIGLVAGVAFYKYRDHIKKERYESAAALMSDDEFSENVVDIAEMLSDLYELQLANCTARDARTLAEGCVKAISREILKNESFRFRELLNISSLQAVLMRSLKAMPKTKLDMSMDASNKLNTRGLVGHSAYYCRETDEFYKTAKSKALKYGVLFFDKKADLEDYEYIMTTSSKLGEQWSLTRMRPHEVSSMLQSSIFKAYRNDKVFMEKIMEDVEDNDRMKVT